jgi:hypothetical protein
MQGTYKVTVLLCVLFLFIGCKERLKEKSEEIFSFKQFNSYGEVIENINKGRRTSNIEKMNMLDGTHILFEDSTLSLINDDSTVSIKYNRVEITNNRGDLKWNLTDYYPASIYRIFSNNGIFYIVELQKRQTSTGLNGSISKKIIINAQHWTFDDSYVRFSSSMISEKDDNLSLISLERSALLSDISICGCTVFEVIQKNLMTFKDHKISALLYKNCEKDNTYFLAKGSIELKEENIKKLMEIGDCL